MGGGGGGGAYNLVSPPANDGLPGEVPTGGGGFLGNNGGNGGAVGGVGGTGGTGNFFNVGGNAGQSAL